MASQAIHFGTSGWRGVIADDFTFPGVRRAAAAIADYARTRKKSPVLLVAHDTRFFSPEFARAAAEVLRERGCRVLLCPAPTPTPAVAHAILHQNLDGGINITASHNPAEYNGLKFSGPEGGPALPEVTREIEQRAAALGEIAAPSRDNLPEFEMVDLREPYFAEIEKLVRFEVLAKSKGNFVCDALHGCGAGWLDALLHRHKISAEMIRGERDVLFEGAGPDPSEENLAAPREAVRRKKALAGLATDGDADRFGILDNDGSFVSPNYILALVFDYLLETRAEKNGEKRGASRSVATTHLMDAVARLHGTQIYETPVGFKYVGPLLREDKIILGGEESAGLTIRGHVPEKDGILACLLVAEMIAARQAPLREQLQDLFRRVGREYYPVRVNLHVSANVQAGLPARLRADFREFAGRRVTETNRKDGLKLIFEHGSWMLMRLSGTEPLVRVYTEAETPEASQRLAEEARAWINQ